MNCTHCGTGNLPDARFCSGCGAGLPLVCAQCGAVVPALSRYCSACGWMARGGNEAPGCANDFRQGSPERKIVTVLFADFAGFTAYAANRDAEEVHETMRSLWRRLDPVISAYDGRVEKHMGDAVLALFGEKPGREDGPAQAVRAGLAMQACLRQPSSGQAESELRLRVGIHTGLVILEPTAADGEFKATGDTLNLASRLQQQAPVGGVIISHETFRMIYGLFDMQALPPLALKGKAEPVQAYLVSRAKSRSVARQLRDIEGVSTEMIGRKAELERLQAGFRTVLEESESHVVTVIGEAGIGKSRLLQEFQHWAELIPQHFWLFFGQARAEMPALPFALMRDVFAGRCEIQDNDSPETARQKLETGLLELVARSAEATTWSGHESRQMAHFIGQLLGLDFSESPYIKHLLNDPEQIRQRAYHYLRKFFTAMSRGTPPTAEGPSVRGVLLVLEDIHWSDAASLDLVDHLARECKQVPLMILCLARPALLEKRPSWGEGLPAHTRFQLESLSKRESRVLVDTILRKAREVPASLRELIVEGAEGNPFYIEEIVKMLVDQKVIIPGPDEWRIELQRLAAISVPPTLAGVLQARLNGLSPLEYALVQRASVIGRVFWDRALEHMFAASEDQGGFKSHAPVQAVSRAEVQEALASLRRKDLVFQREASAFAGATEFLFKHELLRNATYETLLKKRRREYHGQVAAWLVEESGSRSGEFASQVAQHLEAAGRATEAAEWYGRAGLQARSGWEPAMAIACMRKALQLAPDEAPQKRLKWLEVLGESLCAQAQFAEAAGVCEQMRSLAESVADSVGQARAWNTLAFVQERKADNRASVEAARRAEELARAAGESGRTELMRALHYRGWALYRLAEWQAVFELAKQTQALCEQSNDRHGLAISLKLQGVVSLQRGEYASAERLFLQGLELCREFGDRRNAAAMWSNLGESARLRGDFTRAFTFYEKALAIARLIGNRESEIIYRSNLNGARLGLGQFKEAETDLRELITLATSQTSSVLAEAFAFLAEACLGQGNFPEAIQAAKRSLDLARQSGNDLDRGIAWRLIGRLLARKYLEIPRQFRNDAVAEAEPRHCFSESLALFNRINSNTEQARTVRAWGEYEVALGHTQQGLAKLKEAWSKFEALGIGAEAAGTEALIREEEAKLALLGISGPAQKPAVPFKAGPDRTA